LNNNNEDFHINRKSLIAALSAGIIYLVLASIYTGITKHNIHKTMFSPSGDPFYFLFFLKWWPWAILHHVNPFITSYLTYPATYNLAWVTSIPALSIMAAPLTLSDGPVFVWNILCFLAPATSAFAMYILLRYFQRSFFAATVGGYIFGFSTYEMAQLLGHIHLVFLFPIPLMILLAVKKMNGSLSSTRFLLGNALLYSFMVGTSIEIATTFTIFSTLSVIIFYIFTPSLRTKIKSLVIVELLSGTIAAIILSPFLYYIITGINSIHGPINSPTFYSADLLNYIIPTPITDIGKHLFVNIASRFTGNYAEEGAYIGIILAALTLLSMRETKGVWVKALTIITAMLFLFSLGPNLHVNGDTTKIVLPWNFLLFSPLNSALPARFTMYISLCVSLWVSVWIDGSINRTGALLRYATVLLGVLLIVPNWGSYAWAKPNIPNKSEVDFIKNHVKKGENILILPTAPYGAGPLWLIGTDISFHLSGGPWGYDPYRKTLGYNRWPAMRMFNSDTVDPDYKAQITAFCVTHHVNDIMVAPSINQILVQPIKHLGWPVLSKGQISLYKVPKSGTTKYSNITLGDMKNLSLVFQLHRLKRAAACYLKKGGLLSGLTPATANKLGCLTSAYKSSKRGGHWTKLGGWLGPQGSDVGVGVGVKGKTALNLIREMSGQEKVLFYDPKPQPESAADLNTNKIGTLMFLFTKEYMNSQKEQEK
jgi:hypothetical protein